MASKKVGLPKGTRDFGPSVMAKRNYILSAIKTTFENFGFSQIETPAMENLDVLTGKYGEEGDQLLYKVVNSGDFLKDVDASDLDQGYKKTTFKNLLRKKDKLSTQVALMKSLIQEHKV